MAKAPALLPDTLALLEKAIKKGLTQVEIMKHTELRYQWQTHLRYGRMPDPSVRKVQKLHDYLNLWLAENNG